MTNCDGFSPCATIACSSSGSLRMNSAENPTTVDCRMIVTARLVRTPRVRKWRNIFQYLGRPEGAEGSSGVFDDGRQPTRIPRRRIMPDVGQPAAAALQPKQRSALQAPPTQRIG